MAKPLNEHFAPVSFKLVDTPLKGEPTECFEVIGADGRPYNGGLNKAGQVQAGAHIIKRLQEHEGVHLPMWVDDCEGIFDLPEMDCQIIRLIASANEPVLRMEVA